LLAWTRKIRFVEFTVRNPASDTIASLSHDRRITIPNFADVRRHRVAHMPVRLASNLSRFNRFVISGTFAGEKLFAG
jgi:hypothetical protein